MPNLTTSNNYKNAIVIIHTALSAEANPLIKSLQLTKHSAHHGMQLYNNVVNNIWLVQSGIGVIKTACALCYAFFTSGANKYTHFLNIGVVGSSATAIGDAFIINKIHDDTTNLNYYPNVALYKKAPQSLLTTFAKPNTDYDSPGLYDMEGAGFFAASGQCVMQDYIALYKIVSDNHKFKAERIFDKGYVTDLITAKLTDITVVLQSLLEQSEVEYKYYKQPEYFSELMAKIHFSQCQSIQLASLCKSWQVLLPNESPQDYLIKTDTAKSILANMQKILERVSEL